MVLLGFCNCELKINSNIAKLQNLVIEQIKFSKLQQFVVSGRDRTAHFAALPVNPNGKHSWNARTINESTE